MTCCWIIAFFRLLNSIQLINCESTQNYKAFDRSDDIQRWQQESFKFLKSNIFGCSHKVVSNLQSFLQNHSDNSQLITVYFEVPRKQEIKSYRNLPSTLSAANTKLLKILNCSRLVEWSNDKSNRWMIPKDHVGQNRTLCVSLTKLLGQGNVVKLYDQYKSIQKASYIVLGSFY